MRFLLDNVDNDDMEQTLSQTDRPRDGHVEPDVGILNLGRSQELNNEDAGDIADEGPGRRG
jgi:hypothetical protein